jgi:membrane-bound metal-dependent hydrolase YbcI (DUF457 family)
MKLYYGIKIADILLQSVLCILEKFLRIFHDEFPLLWYISEENYVPMWAL